MSVGGQVVEVKHGAVAFPVHFVSGGSWRGFCAYVAAVPTSAFCFPFGLEKRISFE